MRRSMVTMGVLVLTLGLWFGRACPAPPTTVKIGFIDVQRILETSEKGKEFRDKIFQLRKDKEKILSTKQDEIIKARQDYQQKALTLSDRARLDREQELRQKELEFQTLSESYKQEVLLEGRKLQALMLKDLSDIVRQIGQAEGYTIIVEKDATLYAAEAIDITEKVIQQYNAMSRKGGSSGEKK